MASVSRREGGELHVQKRAVGLSRRGFVALALNLSGSAVFASTPLLVRWEDEQIRISAPTFHFLSGKVLNQLQDGHSVGMQFQLTLTGNTRHNVLRRGLCHFVISYDLWEEKFAIVPLHSGLRRVSHLSATAAEAWCLDHVLLSTSGISPESTVWVRLDVRAQSTQEVGPEGDPLDLTSLVELFSRNTRERQMRWSLEAGPMRLASLRRNPDRRP